MLTKSLSLIMLSFPEFFILTDKNFTAPNLNLVNEPDLTRILKFEIFLHLDKQLWAAHVILGYKPVLTSFQSPKYIINAKDPWLHQINIIVPDFLGSPPLASTQPVELPIQRASGEEATSSHLAPEEELNKVIEVIDSEEDFEVFDQSSPIESHCVSLSYLPPIHVSSNQEPSDILEAMVL